MNFIKVILSPNFQHEVSDQTPTSALCLPVWHSVHFARNVAKTGNVISHFMLMMYQYIYIFLFQGL